ncbi:gamma-glutamyltransferase [uncultured Sneathiella sp.]|uniref:gamma-glutamyltransferase family protein n=1 Tax=uncultured Sneathiella sp. TaxID=879315 RepID=UPI002593157B|nr:gamma-glutamyltransferase [uncultured Sneathiella sp.]
MGHVSGVQGTTLNSSYAVSVGHDVAAGIAADVLEAGGNAIDAGVAASIALTVLHSEQVQFGGVAPILLYIADENRYFSIEGAGRWPASANPGFFEEKHRGRIPQGILRTVVPAAPDAWVTALSRFGTMSFADLAGPAQVLAAEGFSAHEDLVSCSAQFERHYRRISDDNARIWLPNDAPVKPGQKFRLPDLANTISILIDAEKKAASKAGRARGLEAVRDAFYKGEIADAMIQHVKTYDGWLTHADLAAHHTPVVEATRARVFGGSLFTPGSWTQGPALSQALQILEAGGIARHGHQSVDACHMMIEALKLALVDREAFYGDPDFVDVPLDILLSPAYAASRAAMIQMESAIHPLPAAGQIPEKPIPRRVTPNNTGENAVTLDTSIAAIIDGGGNIFVSTPSDPSFDGPVVPELGFVISTRGAQSYTDAGHPACLQAGKRPRVSAYPLIFREGNGRHIAGGGPGADLQLQAMAQTLIHHLAHNLSLSEALNAPRVFTHGIPASTEPHLSFAGKVVIEETAPEAMMTGLSALGHKASLGKVGGIAQPSICLVAGHPDQEMEAVGDPRRANGQRIKQNPHSGKGAS